MSMTYADNFYTNNTEKVFDMVCDPDTSEFSGREFEAVMEKLKDEEMNRLFEENQKLITLNKELVEALMRIAFEVPCCTREEAREVLAKIKEKE